MARQVLPFVGAAVGFFFGSPQLGFLIGSIIGNAVDPQVIRGPRIGDAGIQTAAEGGFRPVVRGKIAIKGNVIERGNRVVRKDRQQAGKGGPVTETERVYWTFAIALGEPIQGILRIWQDEKLVYDIRPGSAIPEETSEFAGQIRIYLGSEDQLPDPDLEVIHGVGNTHAYPGTAYVVFPNFDLTDYRERIPDFRFEVLGDGGIFEWDGSWTFYPAPIIGGVGNVKPAFGNGMAIYGSNQGAWSTVDGQSWRLQTPSPMQGITFWESQNIFVSSHQSSGGLSNVMFSNGVDGWVSVFSEFIDGGGIVAVAEDLGYAISLPAASGDPIALMITDEGLVTPHALGVGPTWVTRLIRSERLGLFIAVCGTDRTPDERIWYSTTGLESTWFKIGNYDTSWHDIIDVADLERLVLCGDGLSTGGPVRLLTGPDLSTLVDRTPAVGVQHFSGATYIPSSGEIVVTPQGTGFPGFSDFLVSTDGDTFDPRPNYYNGNLTSPQWCGAPISRVMSVSTGGLLGDGALLSNSSIEEGVTLGQIVAFLHDRAGQSSDLYDVTELTDPVTGIVFAEEYTAAEGIRTLMPPYFFDASEHDNGVSGYRIRYVKRGKAVVRTLTEADLLDLPERTTREDSLERPKALHLHYQSPTIGYAPAKATVRRSSPDVLVVGERSLQIPVAFENVDEPMQIADKLMRVVWAEVAGEESFTLPDKHLDLVPTDAVGLSLRGQVRRLRLAQEMAEPGAQGYRAALDRQSAYTSQLTGIPLPLPTPPIPSIVGMTEFEFLDIPALNDGNDRLLYYVAATGRTEAWFGAVVDRQLPPDTTWTEATRFSQNTIMGELVAPVADASEYFPDTTNTVEVALYSDDVIEALTDLQFLSEGGAFALEKADGTFEVLQYRDVDETSSGTFVLSHLARGRLNSGTSAHAAGARFVLLDGVRSVDAQAGWLNRDLTHRATSLGMPPDTAATYTDPYIGRSQIEFPVAHLFLSRAGDTITAQAVPRHRFGTETNPVQSINHSGYRWAATDGTNTASLDTGSALPSWAFDATGWGSPITVTVAQLNRITGAGPTVSEQIA